MTPVLVFDIETVPDVAGIRLLYDLGADLTDYEVAEFAFQRRRAATGNDFLPLHLQRVIVISCLLRAENQIRVWSLAEPASNEGELIQRLFDGIEKYIPQLISWNGGGFDLPVLHYRGLVHGVVAPRYWELGEDDREFKWNNYISRYHLRHLDLMDVLALYQPRANAPLDELAKLMGLPGKQGMNGSEVWTAFRDGGIEDIRRYCETDVANTYLVFQRFQLMRGRVSRKEHDDDLRQVREALAALDQPHWREFLANWA